MICLHGIASLVHDNGVQRLPHQYYHTIKFPFSQAVGRRIGSVPTPHNSMKSEYFTINALYSMKTQRKRSLSQEHGRASAAQRLRQRTFPLLPQRAVSGGAANQPVSAIQVMIAKRPPGARKAAGFPEKQTCYFSGNPAALPSAIKRLAMSRCLDGDQAAFSGSLFGCEERTPVQPASYAIPFTS